MPAQDNLVFLNLEKAGRALLLAFFTDIPIAMWGAPGIGKSSKVYQLAEKLHMKLYDFRLSDKEAQDIGGIPYPVKVGEVPAYIEYLIARGLLPFGTHNTDCNGFREDGTTVCPGCEDCILFLDEVDRTSDPNVRNAIQQVILDRRINGHVLSFGCRIVMAGNGTSDMDTTPLSKAANGRMCHVCIENDSPEALDSWAAWADEEIEHPDFGTITRASTLLKGFARSHHQVWINGQATEKIQLAEQAEPTNRTWVYADQFIRASEFITSYRTNDILLALVAGCVGKGPAQELLAYRRLHDKCPTIEQIIADPEKVAVPPEPDLLASLVYSLTDEAKRDRAVGEAVATYGLRWPEEPAAFLFRRLLDKQPLVATTTPYQQWSHKRLRSAPTSKSASYTNHFPELVKIFAGSKPLPENDLWINRLQIPSESSSGTYILSQNRKDRTWACSCRGWISRRTCKHTQRLPEPMTAEGLTKATV